MASGDDAPQDHEGRVCAECGEQKALTEFELNGNGGKRRRKCKTCRNRSRWPGSKKRVKRTGDHLTCSKCGKTKDACEFHLKSSGAERRQSWCKQCMKENANSEDGKKRRRAYYEDNKDKIVSRSTQWRKDNPIRVAFSNLRSSAASRDVSFGLTFEEFKDILSTSDCPICGVKMMEKGSTRRGNPRSKSVDRVDPCGSYTLSNCACICLRCNQIKNEGSFEDHLAIAYWMMERI